MPKLDFEWEGPAIPGTPLLVVVVTTAGIVPVYAPALAQVAPEDQPAIAREMVVVFRAMADKLERAVEDVAAAVDDAIREGAAS